MDELHIRPIRATVAVCLFGLLGCAAAVLAFMASMPVLKAHHAGFAAVTAATVIFGAAILAVAAATARLGQKLSRQAPLPAMRRYTRRFMAAMSLYVVTLIAAVDAHMWVRPTGALAYALAVAPALPLLATIVIMGLYLREETDEFQRAVHMESALLATGGMLAVATVWGFLEMFGLVPHVPAWVAYPLWAGLLGPAQAIARWRYR